jgi:uncharacterized protein YegL
MVDVSGSMNTNGKISIVNRCIVEMLQSFQEDDSEFVEIQVAIITFGNKEAVLFQDLMSASMIKWVDMKAEGQTPMGAAFRLAKELVEDREKFPSRSYAPSLILISDGVPTDEWEKALQELLSSERAAKAARFALAIGDDAQEDMLAAFINDKERPVIKAHNAAGIQGFFRGVTMSVSTRSRSNNPNKIETIELDDFEY